MFSPKKKLKQIPNTDLADVLSNLKQDIMKDINCVQVGMIESYNESKQTAIVRLLIKRIIDETLDGNKILEERGVLVDCPVFNLQGGDSFISMPIKKGDNCIVLFNDRDIDNWFFSSDGSRPNTNRTHDLSDGLVMVGINNNNNSISGITSDSIKIHFDDSNNIEFKNALTESTVLNFIQNGNMTVTGGLIIGGAVTQKDGTPLLVNADVTQQAGKILKAGNGATGVFVSADAKTITVTNGIITQIV